MGQGRVKNRDIDKAGEWVFEVRGPLGDERHYFELMLCAVDRETGEEVRQHFCQSAPAVLAFQEYKDKYEKEIRRAVRRQINQGCIDVINNYDAPTLKRHFYYDTDWWLE